MVEEGKLAEMKVGAGGICIWLPRRYSRMGRQTLALRVEVPVTVTDRQCDTLRRKASDGVTAAQSQ